jgi:Alpha/beta hydrolase domain
MRPPVMPRIAHVAALGLVLLSLVAAGAASAAPSRVTSLSVTGRQALDGGYERVHGIAHGVVSGREHVRGLPTAGLRYSVQYEILRPVKAKPRLLLVEAENRGSPVVLNALNSGAGASGPPATATYPRSASRLLRSEGLAYARVQWQTGIAADVPATAQGVGEVIVRDFARFLAHRYPHRALVGDSQGAFFADTFIAEGWNAAPGGGRAFAEALTIDGNGNWMAINDYAGKGAENAYLRPDGRPFAYRRLLRRPRTDPVLIDVANYTDFYRLRAGLTDRAAPPAGVHRYDWASPHQSFGPSLVFGALRCNGGTPIPLNPLRNQPYLRALVHGMASARLPASKRFSLGPHPRTSAGFNGLPGVAVAVPRTDALAQPLGGVRFPELGEPLGRLTPVSLSPAVTTSAGAVCGNSGGFTPFSAATVRGRSSRATYLARYGRALTRLEHAGYVRPADRAAMLAAARADYVAAAG